MCKDDNIYLAIQYIIQIDDKLKIEQKVDLTKYTKQYNIKFIFLTLFFNLIITIKSIQTKIKITQEFK